MKPGRRRESGIVQLICSLSTSLAGYWPRPSSSSARRVIIDRTDELCIGYNCFPCPRRLMLTVHQRSKCSIDCDYVLSTLHMALERGLLSHHRKPCPRHQRVDYGATVERNIPRTPRSKEFCSSPGRSPLPSILSTWLAE
jgi:hypothetical protein